MRAHPLIARIAGGLVICALGAVLIERHLEERRDRTVAIAVEWTEVRDLAARLALPRKELLSRLKAQGVTTLVLSPTTLNDLALHHLVTPSGGSTNQDPFDVSQILFANSALAHQAFLQLTWRGVPDLIQQPDENGAVLYRPAGAFMALKDVDLGFEPETLAALRDAGMVPLLRVYGDTWMSLDHAAAYIANLPGGYPRLGLLLSSDDLPGGPGMLPAWRAWIQQAGVTQFLPEFHPSSAAWLAARALPANTYRLHTIPTAELKDLKPPEQLSRWRRAVNERSCRCLLMHAGPTDSFDSFLSSIATLHAMLVRQGWQDGLPAPRQGWLPVHALRRQVASALAFWLAVLAPLLALRWGRPPRGSALSAFFRTSAITLAGALAVAAIAQTPETRLEIIPFRGIKLVFILSWGAALLMLYDWKALRQKASQNVKRWEIVAGVAAVGIIGYLLVRTGNAPAAWKNSWEQSIRDWLEITLIARPRFKEFCIGHPALLLGLYLQSLPLKRRLFKDPRPWIWAGMIGQISIVNTFCHLHSPLGLELRRTFYGLILGVAIGWALVHLLERWRGAKKTSPGAEAETKRVFAFLNN